MKKNYTKYKVASIAHCPEDLEFPWVVVRQGFTAKQGGDSTGAESIFFKSATSAYSFLSLLLKEDVDLFKEIINKKNKA